MKTISTSGPVVGVFRGFEPAFALREQSGLEPVPTALPLAAAQFLQLCRCGGRRVDEVEVKLAGRVGEPAVVEPHQQGPAALEGLELPQRSLGIG